MKEAYYQPAGLNKFWLGFLVGLVLPALFFLLYFLFRFRDLSIGHYFQLLAQTGKIVHVMSLAVFPNSIPFMFFVRSSRFRSGRGIMAITIIYAILTFALKIVL